MNTGIAFGDYISTGKSQKRRGYHDQYVRSFRAYLLPLFLVVVSALLIFKLFSLQVMNGSYYRIISDSNRTRTSILYAPRGIIFDRNRNPAVYNTPGFRLIQKDKKVKFLSREKAMEMIAKGEKKLQVDALREYPFGESLSHVLGYIGQISEEELQEEEFAEYNSGALIGKMGIERYYEHLLSGQDGKTLIEVESSGKKVRTLGQTDPIPGQDITLTIDAKFQQAIYNATKDIKKGVIIVSSPNGEILALLSMPSFDPNLFTLDDTYKVATDAAYRKIEDVLLDYDNQPLLDRAISGTYPPGSTFKLITAAAGLQNNIIDERFRVEDTGVVKLGAFSFSNWYFTQYGKKDGDVGVVKAIARSNDIFFYKLAEKIGVDALAKEAEKYGVGSQLGIDLPGEAKGILPTKQWKEEYMKEQWYLGDTYHYGIGQGYLLTTPLQVNAWTQAIANKGVLHQPHLLKGERGKRIAESLLREKSYELIWKGMMDACSKGGVAWPLFEFQVKNESLKIDGKNFLEVPQSTTSANFKDYRRVSIACKTGTTQHGGEKTLPHAWITLFAPVENPEIVVTVLVESSGEGSNVAAPVAKKVLEAWFGR